MVAGAPAAAVAEAAAELTLLRVQPASAHTEAGPSRALHVHEHYPNATNSTSAPGAAARLAAVQAQLAASEAARSQLAASLRDCEAARAALALQLNERDAQLAAEASRALHAEARCAHMRSELCIAAAQLAAAAAAGGEASSSDAPAGAPMIRPVMPGSAQLGG